MADVQPRTRGSITAGRPLPPRREAPMAPAANDLPPRPGQIHQVAAAPMAAGVASSAAPRAVIAAAAVGRLRPNRPQPGPMRIALGAGAVAAISVMTVGFVKPNFDGASAEQPATGQQTTDATNAQDVQAQARHVTRYVFLEPGQKAPRGATVISAERAARLGLDPQPGTQPAANVRRNPAPARNSNAAPAPDPAPPVAQPAPPKPPRIKTRQSGGG